MSDIAALLTWTNIRFLLEGLGLTLVISARARQLSERKDLGGDEKYISKAVSDVTEGRISYKIIDPLPKTEDVPAA